jgi:DNA-binding SARP family transcriptional activator/tetratricopeptide (TPR) repeat protein
MEFGVLGPLQVRSDGRPIPVGAPMQRALLAALLLHANQVVAAEQLIDYLWDQTPPPSARTTLQNYILRLRRLLPPRPERAARPLLVTTAPGYLLQLRPGELDLDRFQRLVADARASTTQGQLGRAASLLRDALALWRGPPLCDVASEPLRRRHLPRLEDQRLGALEARIDADLQLGLHAELTGELHGLVDEQPLRERFRAQLMLALYRCGRQAEALEVFRATWRLLHGELGIQPGPDLRRLEQAILREDPSLDLPAIAVADRPPAAAISPPHQLPPAVTDFTGRRQHLDELDRFLGSGADTTAVVLSAIAGTAGVGKTALAIHWAHRARDRLPDGQLYVNLGGYAPTPPMRAIDALAGFLHALGVPAEQVPLDLEEAAALYRTLLADKRMLVVLDNARSADQVRPLLPGSPGCLVLVTSRDRLGGLVARDGARRLTLDGLPPQEAVGLLARLLGAERVAAEPQAAEELAEVCGRLPLALRIAAANLADQPGPSIAGYVARLRRGDRLAELAVDGDPQAAVRIAFDCSYAALDPGAQRLFRLLGLVPGPDVTHAAAAALGRISCQMAAMVLDRLAAAHLVTEHAPGRYALHDLLRRYAAERAHAEDGVEDCAAARRRLFDWYLEAAAVAIQLLHPETLHPSQPAQQVQPASQFHDHVQALEWLDAERPNLVACVQQAADHGPHPVAWLLAETLRSYLVLHGHRVDWLVVAQAALAAAEAEGDRRAQAGAQLGLGDLHRRQGRIEQAIIQYALALALGRETGWLEGQGTALGGLGLSHWQAGRLHEAADHHIKALAIFRQTDRLASQAVSLTNMGLVNRQLGRLRQAISQYTKALELNREVESRGLQAILVENLGEIDHVLGRVDQALDRLDWALRLNREIGNPANEADTLHVLAGVHRDTGRHAQALELARAGVSLARDTGLHRLRATTLNTLGTIQHRLGAHAEAATQHQQALLMARSGGTRYPEAVALIELAATCQALDQHGRAMAYAEEALALTRQGGYRILEGQAHVVLAQLHQMLEPPDKAVEHSRTALAIFSDTGYRLGQANALVALGHAVGRTGGAGATRTVWRQALGLFADLGAPDANQVRDLLQTHAR